MTDHESGRIVSVESIPLGSDLSGDHLAGVTELTVHDAVDFDWDGGSLVIDGQVIAYTTFNDDTGVITLDGALAVAADDGTRVDVYDTLYRRASVEKVALVELDGDTYNTDAVTCTVANHLVDKLADGLRDTNGESVLIEIDSAEWRIIDVLGLGDPEATGQQYEADDVYVVTSADVTAGSAAPTLSHAPINESVKAFWGPLAQQPTEYTVSGNTVTWPLSGFEKAGDPLWFHYAYLHEIGGGTFTAINYATGVDNPVTAPAGATVGDLLLLAIMLPSDMAGASALNGYTLVGETANVTHSAGFAGETLTYRLAIYQAAATAEGVTAPTFPANVKDTPWLHGAFRGAGATLSGSSLSTLEDGASASTAPLDGANLHVFATISRNVRIVPDAGATAAEAGASQIDILIVKDVDTDPAGAHIEASGDPFLSTAGWCMAALKVGD